MSLVAWILSFLIILTLANQFGHYTSRHKICMDIKVEFIKSYKYGAEQQKKKNSCNLDMIHERWSDEAGDN